MFNSRRFILAGAAALAAAPIARAVAQAQPQASRNPAAMPVPDVSGVRTAKQFAMGVIGPAELSLVTSQIAMERATNPMAKEFAGFEHTEAVAVTTVLKKLGTPVPPMDAKAQATLDKIKAAPNGAAFDQAYIMAQHENHEFLRDIATAYLKNSPAGTAEIAEKQGQHLATLALATFKEHVAITKRISGELQA